MTIARPRRNWKPYKPSLASASSLSPPSKMKFKVTFVDEIEAESEDAAFDSMVQYLADCAKYEDVTGFDFKEIKEKAKRS